MDLPNETHNPGQEQPASYKLLDILADGVFDYFRMIGALFLRFIRGSRLKLSRFYQKRFRRQSHGMDMFWLRIRKWFSNRRRGIAYRVYMFLKFFVDAWRVVKGGFNAKPDRNILLRLCGAAAAFGRGVRNNARMFLTALNYLLPTAAAVAFVMLVQYVAELNFAVSVEYNGEHVGFVADETVYEQAETKLQERLLYQDGDELLDKIPKFEVMVVDPADMTQEPARLTDTIIRSSSADMVQATGIKIDGRFIGAVKDMEPVSTLLDNMLDEYRTAAPGEKVEFLRDIQTESGLYLQRNVVAETEVLSVLTSQTEQDVYYTAVAGDTPSEIAAAYEMTTDELVAMNPSILTDLKIGQQVLVNRSQPFLPVKCIRTETYSVEVPFETVYVDTKDLYEGQKKTLVEGQKGFNRIEAEVSYVDGVEIERTVLSTTSVQEPVAQKIARGTRVMPVVQSFSGPRSDLGFINPIGSGTPYVSQGFGRTRYSSNHTGIDIAFRGNGYGTPILATLPGTVEFSGWQGSYGNLVIINHGGGLKTYYAHCSKLVVSRGETVSQGQQIANVGSTGRSTGNHCHYMVVENGVYRNPLNYIPGF
ncbi:MAG: peptidoglycan DD-metalloendopeptidase family protein [Oscillospiraceae bacterium]|jgi:murein DD-endopeptidase MepM/ murein hydrolase activator NlpD|nr:peptidoglycan DD-metalloendopeptidase family protein [Oscillospiraceae bacterium]